jgi:hypothetical protein
MKRLVMLVVVSAVPFLVGCAPECVDLYDCAARAKADKRAYTCEANVCKAGSPFVEPTDAGTP